MSKKFCTQCGNSIKPGSGFCTACGAEVVQPKNNLTTPLDSTKSSSEIPKTVISTARKLIGNTTSASDAGGEMTFTQALPSIGGLIPGVELGPFRYLLGSVGRLFKGIKGVYKNKKMIIPVIVLSLIWLLLLLLQTIGINTSSIRILSFLTFAQGGTGGGILGMAGGIIGKGVFAYFISGLLMPSGGRSLVGFGRGFKSFFRSFKIKEKETTLLVLLGAGLALIGYNFLTGNASLHNSMAGIIAFLLSLRALANKNGFLRGFFMSLFSKFNMGKKPDLSDINGIMAGWAAGFALGIPLSLTGISSIGYIAGLILVITAAAFKFVSKNKKEVIAG